MQDKDYAPCARCGRLRYLGAFCECATAAEKEKYWSTVFQPSASMAALPEPKAVPRHWRPSDVASCVHKWILAARGLVRCLNCGAERAG